MLIEMLRKKIRNCGKSLNQLSRETGVDVAALCRIVNGGDCKTVTADKLLKYFGLELKPKKKAR
jgi:plasmid maintenance system antidote protein VapI